MIISHDWKAGAAKNNKVSFLCSLRHLPALWSNHAFPWPPVRRKLHILDQKHSLLGWRQFNYWWQIWQKFFEVIVFRMAQYSHMGEINQLITVVLITVHQTTNFNLNDEAEKWGEKWGWELCEVTGSRREGGQAGRTCAKICQWEEEIWGKSVIRVLPGFLIWFLLYKCDWGAWSRSQSW